MPIQPLFRYCIITLAFLLSAASISPAQLDKKDPPKPRRPIPEDRPESEEESDEEPRKSRFIMPKERRGKSASQPASRPLAPLVARPTAPRPRVLLLPDDLPWLQARCGLRAAASAPTDNARQDHAAYVGEYRRIASWVDANRDGPIEDGGLYLPAFMHLLTGQAGRADKYTRCIDLELSRRGEVATDFDDMAAALDWCWDALDPAIRNAAAERLAHNMTPLGPGDSPLEHFLFHPKLCHLAAAIALEGTFLEGTNEASRVRHVLDDAESYFDRTLPAYIEQLGGLAPASSLQADMEADLIFAVELWDRHKGGAYWPRVAAGMRSLCDAYFWSETEWPGFFSALSHGHGDGTPRTPGEGQSALSAGVPLVLAQRTRAEVAAWHAAQTRDGAAIDVHSMNRLWLRIVHDDASVPIADRAASPLARRVGGGWLLMRSHWRPGATVVAFNSGQPIWLARQHFDAGQFQIWRKGRLALDSGDDVSSEAVPENGGGAQGLGDEPGEFNAYAAATVAHNCMLLVDPRERQERRGREWPARGNQRLVDGDYKDMGKRLITTDRVTGRLLAFETNPRYSYAAADLARAYNIKTVLLYDRHLLFVGGTMLVVVDRLITDRPDITPTWLLHLPSRPHVNDKDLDAEYRRRGTSEQAGAWMYSQPDQWLSADGGDGRLHVKTILPLQRQWWIVGGPQTVQRVSTGTYAGRAFIGSGPEGFEYWLTPMSLAGGRNAWYKLGAPGLLSASFGVGAAWGRMEVEPLRRATETVFAHVILARDRDDPRPPIKVDASDDLIDIQLDIEGEQYAVRLTPREQEFGQVKVTRSDAVIFERNLATSVPPPDR